MELFVTKKAEMHEARTCSLVVSPKITQEDSEEEPRPSYQNNEPLSDYKVENTVPHRESPKASNQAENTVPHRRSPKPTNQVENTVPHRHSPTASNQGNEKQDTAISTLLRRPLSRLAFEISNSPSDAGYEDDCKKITPQATPNGKYKKAQLDKVKESPKDHPTSCAWREYENRRKAEMMRLQKHSKSSKKKKKQRNSEHLMTKGPNFSSITTDDPFDENYELWEVIHDKTKVRIGKHRKCRKIKELKQGTVVKCSDIREKNRKRFKIEYPLIGYCSFMRSSRSARSVEVTSPISLKNRSALHESPQDASSIIISPTKKLPITESKEEQINDDGEQALSSSTLPPANAAFRRVDPNQLPVLDSRFLLELKLSQGSFGKVFVAWDMKEKKKVAIKINLKSGLEKDKATITPRKDKASSESIGRKAETLPVKDRRASSELIITEDKSPPSSAISPSKKQTDEVSNLDALKDTWRFRVFKKEVQIMRKLTECYCVPSYKYSGIIRSHTNQFKDLDGDGDGSYVGMQYMVTNLQGLSLSCLKKNYLKKFSLKTVMMLGIEFVTILNEIHKVGVLHRDIKPANFVVSRANNGRRIYLLDFGLSMMWVRGDRTHIEYRDNCRRCGTARYSSINTHKRQRQSRRDDLEAAGYVLVLFLQGLPWKQRKAESPELKWNRILIEKLRWNPKKLCCRLPPQIGELFYEYFDYCRSLAFSELPDYEYLKDLFTKTLESNNEKMDSQYDWLSIL